MKNLLIVASDSALNHELSWHLVSRGYRVFSAANQAEAMRQCERKRIDLALFDTELPDADGAELMRMFRTAHPETTTILLAEPKTERPFSDAILLPKPVGLDALEQTMRDIWH